MWKRFQGVALQLTVLFVGILGSVASIYSQWGRTGVTVSVLSISILTILVYLELQPLLARTHRGVTLIHAIRSVGLTDIENREHGAVQSLVSVALYASAKDKVIITAISGSGTIKNHHVALLELLNRGCRVYLLLVHPDSPDLGAITSSEKIPMPAETRNALESLRMRKIIDYPGFKVRFVPRRPHYTAILIDGDVEKLGKSARDLNGIVRVQPAANFNSQHQGVVFQFCKKKTQERDAFTYFADDLREEWRNASEDAELVNNPMRGPAMQDTRSSG